jgi:23S rRNA (uracil1939-C5)-methyltransferase
MPVFDVHTTEMISGGDAIGRLPDGRAVFVVGGAPNERVRIALTKETTRWAQAKIVEILGPSSSRIPTPFAKEFLDGATWAHIEYKAQLQAKERILRSTLERIGGLQSIPVEAMIASPALWHYRNRVEYTFGTHEGRLRLGALTPGSDTNILPARGSALFGERATILLKRILAWAESAPRSIWLPRDRRDGLRSVIFRRGIHTNDLVVHLVATSGFPVDHSLAPYFKELPVTGVIWSTNDAANHITRFDQTTVLAGQRLLTEQVGGRTFSYDVTSFFQGNVTAVELLLTALREHLGNAKRIVDLYTGVGLMGLSTAGETTPLTLIESHTQAIEDAKINACERSGKTTIVESSAATYLAREHLPSDSTVIVDPPRTGLERPVIDAILRDVPTTIAYISCDPATLARDLKLLAMNYQQTFIQPFDFFPQTPHIETLVILVRL